MDCVNSKDMDYKDSGVDIEKGDQFVDWIRSTQPRNAPHADKIISGVGGFAGVFRAAFEHMQEPCLVASTDGIGTKLLLGTQYNRVKDLGQDLVAMCVNDLICCGADPLFFLDYYACGQLDLEQAQDFVQGVREACLASGLFLLGGETAEMPGLYKPGHFDSAGFAVGVVDKSKLLGPRLVKENDVIVAIESSGFHSNGYSLLRKVFENDMDQWVDQLLKPTFLYPSLIEKFKANKMDIHGIANITGGGMSNIPRCLPDNLKAELTAWDLPPVFAEVKKRTGMSDESFFETLNCGVGLAIILPDSEADTLMRISEKQGYKAWKLGQVAEKTTDADKDWCFV